jgi:Polyketide cyclase / dehydrase and lipid transport
MKTIDASATTPASRETVWKLIADESAWPRWGRWSSVTIEGGGEHGLGAIRALVQRPFRVRERVTEWLPGERMSYELLDGMNARGYHASAILEDAPGGGTIIRWHSEYESADPVTAFLLRTAAGDTVKRLAKAAVA